jgi:predicted Zn-dependent protease
MLAKSLARALCGGFAAFAALAGPVAHAQSVIRDAEIEHTLRDFTDPILRAANINPAEVQVTLIGDPVPNAFVARGQRIFLHTGLITAAENPNEVIGVIAHETGHISGGHLARMRDAMRQAQTPAWIAIGVGILAIAAGAPDAGVSLIAGAPQFAMGSFVRHTQTQESSADQAAVTYLDATGQSGAGLISFFEREFRPNEFMTRRLPPYLMTHPFTSDRVQALRQRVEASPYYNTPPSAETTLEFDMMKAKLIGFLSPVTETRSLYPRSDTSLPARYARAIASHREPNPPQARAEIQALIDDYPENPYFQELMGQMLFEGGDSAGAVPFHRRSVELAPGEPLLEVNLARALLGLNQEAATREAVQHLEASLSVDRENGLAWRELSTAYDRLGEAGLARLASAEQFYVGGNFPLARNFAERARRELSPETQPIAYRRVDDIITFTQNALEDAENRRN